MGPTKVKATKLKTKIFWCHVFCSFEQAKYWNLSLTINKQLLDEVFVISRITKVNVRVISQSWRLKLITLTETLIVLNITKTESNNCFIIHWTQKTWKSCFCFFIKGKQQELREVDMITLGNHTLWSCMTWLPVALTWLLYNLQLWRHGCWFRKFTVRFRPSRKELESLMYNNVNYWKLRCVEKLFLYSWGLELKVHVGIRVRSIFAANFISEIHISY